MCNTNVNNRMDLLVSRVEIMWLCYYMTIENIKIMILLIPTGTKTVLIEPRDLTTAVDKNSNLK